jgi:hypothetical protein
MWDMLLFVGGMTAIAFLLFGPGMWSSDTEFIAVRMWRRLRGKPGAPKPPGERDPS